MFRVRVRVRFRVRVRLGVQSLKTKGEKGRVRVKRTNFIGK